MKLKFFYNLKFRTQLIISFALVIFFIIITILLMLHVILRDSYREQESLVLETHGRQIAINIDSRMEYFMSYLQLLSKERILVTAMETEDFNHVVDILAQASSEFMNLNKGSICGIRLYRNGIYGMVDGLGDINEIFNAFWPKGAIYPNNVLITGSYLNSRNEKVFSIFKKVYQTNSNREYFIEMCVYETEIFGFFSEDVSGNKIYIFNNESLISMNDRQVFSNLLYVSRNTHGYVVKKSSIKWPEQAILISNKGKSGIDVLLETSSAYLDHGYHMMLIRMVPVFITVIFIAVAFSTMISARLHRRLKTLQEKIAMIYNWNLNEKLQIEGHDEFGMLADELEDTRKRILQLIEQNNDMNEQMRIAEMSALRAQINSHFLFNSLSSIKWLSRGGNQNALAEAVDSLALFLRYSLSLNENQVMLASEVKQLEAYVHLQRLRYGDELNVQIDIDDELLPHKTVKLILQPLVENAIYHGRRGNSSPLNITIYSYKDDNFYYLVVEDDGKGISPEHLQEIRQGKVSVSKSGYGLKNVINRVHMCLNDLGDVCIESQPNISTRITIRQPL